MSKSKIKIRYRDKKCNKVQLQKEIEGQKLNPLRTMSEGEKNKKKIKVEKSRIWREREEKSERTIKKDLRMQMYGKRRGKKKKRESANRESKGGKVLTSQRTKRERVSENGRNGEGGGGGGGGECRMRGTGNAGEEGKRERERNVGGVGERGPRAERRGRESDGKNQ